MRGMQQQTIRIKRDTKNNDFHLIQQDNMGRGISKRIETPCETKSESLLYEARV